MTYCSDPNFLGYLILLIDIDFVELNSSEGWIVRELLENWRYHSAWPTPRSPKVYNDGLVTINLSCHRQELGRGGKVTVTYDGLELVV